MKKIAIVILCFVFSAVGYAAEPDNLTEVKQDLKKYHDSGEYGYEMERVADQAYDYLQERIEKNNEAKKPKKIAIVLDIDETAISNYNFMLRHDFSSKWAPYVQELKGTVIPSTHDIVELAEKNNVAVFFITGRMEKNRELTLKNLHDAGYQGWTKLYMRPLKYNKVSVVPYKSGAREDIAKQGWDIVLNMGDQYSDLKGGYADRTYKFPDPYYYVP